MIASDRLELDQSVARQVARERWTWRFGYVAVMGFGVLLTGLAWRRAPGLISIALALLVFLLGAWAVRPLAALHLTVFFALVGDSVTAPWYPMAKNFSSGESVLYLAERLTFSPMDLTLGFAMVCLLLRRVAVQSPLVTGPLLRPLLVFSGFVVLGFVYGIASGGDVRVAIFEVRPLVYLPIIYMLASNFCTTAGQYRRLLWTAMGAIFCNALLSLNYYLRLTDDAKSSLESLGEHGSAVGMNALFILLIACCVFTGCASRSRFVLVLMSLPVVWVYFLSNRRAAFVGLLAGMVVLSVALFWRQPRTFFKFVPVAAVVAARLSRSLLELQVRRGVPRPSRQVGDLPGHVERQGPELGPLSADREQQPQLHDPSDEGIRRRFRKSLLPAVSAAELGSQLRVPQLHPAQRVSCGSGCRRASWASSRCCTCSPEP